MSELHQKISYLPDIHRLLPQAPDAERGLVCSFLIAPNEVGALCASKGVKPDWMHLPAHSQILTTLQELWDANTPIDFISLTQILRDRGQLDQVGGGAFITDLFTYLPTAANAAYYAEVLLEKFTLREIIKTCTEYAARSYDEQDAVPTLLDEVEAKILAIRKNDDAELREREPKELVMEVVQRIESLYERRGAISGISTGFHDLDQMIDGLHPQEMVVIAARPSMGKTAFAMNIAEHVATVEKRTVAVFSLEMSDLALMQRAVLSRARVNMHSVRSGILSERDFPALTEAAAKISAGGRLRIVDAVGATIGAIRAKARRLARRHKDLSVIFIDYIQKARSTSKQALGSREREIAEISSGLKDIAKELNIPVVVLAQLNRDVEKRKGETKGRPQLSDLRESGSIEQDADVVGLLYRDEYYAEGEEAKREVEGKATLIIAKSRNGPVGDVPLTFLKEFARYETRAREAEPEPRENPHRPRRPTDET